MSLRAYLESLRQTGSFVDIDKPVSKHLQIAGILKALEPQPVRFTSIFETPFPVMGNLLCTKESFAQYLGIPVQKIIPTLIDAIDNHTPPQFTTDAPYHEVIVTDPDLDSLPILFHCEGDGGNYISSGVMISRHPQHGQNLDFHRCMQFSKTEMAVRVVKTRDFDTFLQDTKLQCLANNYFVRY